MLGLQTNIIENVRRRNYLEVESEMTPRIQHRPGSRRKGAALEWRGGGEGVDSAIHNRQKQNCGLHKIEVYFSLT